MVYMNPATIRTIRTIHAFSAAIALGMGMAVSILFGLTVGPQHPPKSNPAEVISAPAECVVLAGTVDEDPDGVDRLIAAEGTGRFDYVGGAPGEWVAEGGDGRIVGYSAAEDSAIYTTAACAR